jgi:hypothetical protein
MRFWEPLLQPKFLRDNLDAFTAAREYLGKFGLLFGDDDWNDWRANIVALHAVHAARERGIAHVPYQKHIDGVLSHVRLWIMPERFPEATIQYHVAATSARDNLCVFWQKVWLSFFDERVVFPGVPVSICWACFEPMPPTPKTGKLSRQRLCAKCRKRESRSRHPQAARASTRRWKEKSRSERRKSKKRASK